MSLPAHEVASTCCYDSNLWTYTLTHMPTGAEASASSSWAEQAYSEALSRLEVKVAQGSPVHDLELYRW